MSKPQELLPPQKDREDRVREIITKLLSQIPGAGPVVELFAHFLREPFQERFEKWAEDVTTGLQKLQESVEEFTPETLVANEVFTTTLAQTTREAVITHQQETLDALRNAVLNSALPGAPDADRQKMFVQLASELTPLHLKLLLFFEKPGTISNLSASNWRQDFALKQLADDIETEFPEMKGHFHTYVQALHDLHQQGLLVDEHPERNTPSRLSSDGSELSQFAREFLKFIKSPLDGKVQG